MNTYKITKDGVTKVFHRASLQDQLKQLEISGTGEETIYTSLWKVFESGVTSIKL